MEAIEDARVGRERDTLAVANGRDVGDGQALSRNHNGHVGRLLAAAKCGGGC